jgi:hypothetical protein
MSLTQNPCIGILLFSPCALTIYIGDTKLAIFGVSYSYIYTDTKNLFFYSIFIPISYLLHVKDFTHHFFHHHPTVYLSHTTHKNI